MTLSKSLFAAALASFAVACSGGADPSPSTSSSSSSGSSSSKQPASDQSPTETKQPTSSSSGGSSSGGTSKPSGATNVSCQVADDCGNWFCDCQASNGDVTPVNAANCKNGWCLDAASSCPDACEAFGKTWAGTAGGGPDQK